MSRRDLSAIALTAALIPLNSTLIALALPDIARSLGSSVGATAWLVSGYLIVTVAVQPLAGKLGDRFGRGRAMAAGLIAFSLASVASALAPTLGVLIATRVLQGCFGALMFANALALLRGLPERERGRAIGLVTAVLSVAPAIGLPLGGLLLELADWRAIFLLNVPLAAAALALSGRLRAERPAPQDGRFDILGAVWLCALLATLAFALEGAGDIEPPVLVALGLGFACGLALWVGFENRHPNPVLPPRLFRRAPFAVATAGLALSNLAMYVALLTVPLLVSSGEAGLLLAGFTAAAALCSALAGRLVNRAGRRVPAVAGLALLAAGMAPLAAAGDDAGTGLLLGCLVAAGCGLGLSNVALFSAGMEALDARDAGLATSVLSTGRYLGAIVASSLLALAAGNGSGADALFLTAAVAAALGSALAVMLGGSRTVRP